MSRRSWPLSDVLTAYTATFLTARDCVAFSMVRRNVHQAVASVWAEPKPCLTIDQITDPAWCFTPWRNGNGWNFSLWWMWPERLLASLCFEQENDPGLTRNKMITMSIGPSVYILSASIMKPDDGKEMKCALGFINFTSRKRLGHSIIPFHASDQRTYENVCTFMEDHLRRVMAATDFDNDDKNKIDIFMISTLSNAATAQKNDLLSVLNAANPGVMHLTSDTLVPVADSRNLIAHCPKRMSSRFLRWRFHHAPHAVPATCTPRINLPPQSDTPQTHSAKPAPARLPMPKLMANFRQYRKSFTKQHPELRLDILE